MGAQLLMSMQQEQLKRIADAIRTQEGSTELISADTFYQRVLALPQGERVKDSVIAEPTAQGYLDAIEKAIRLKEGSTEHIAPKEFADRILALQKKASLLPEGYVELEYLGVKDASLVIGYVPYLSVGATSGAYSLEAKVLTTHLQGTGGSYPMIAIAGRYAGSGSTLALYALGFWSQFWSASGTIDGTSGYGDRIAVRQGTYNASNGRMGFMKPSTNTEYTLRIYPSAKQLEINGTAYTYKAQSSSTAWVSKAVTLFYVANSTYFTVARGLRIYYMKWYDDGGNVLRHLIPCKDPSGVPGMYDAVKKEFFKNVNTNSASSFEAGPEV